MDRGHHPLDRGFDSFLGMPSGSRFVDPAWAPRAHRSRLRGYGRTRRFRPAPRAFPRTQAHPDGSVLDGHVGRRGRGLHRAPQRRVRSFSIWRSMPRTARFKRSTSTTMRFPHVGKRNVAHLLGDDRRARRLGRRRPRQAAGARPRAKHAGHFHQRQRRGEIPATWTASATSRSSATSAICTKAASALPYVMQWKERLEGGGKYRPPVSSLDIFPTVLAAAGAEDLSGVSAGRRKSFALRRRRKTGASHECLFWRSGPNRAARQGPWKLLLSETN